LAAGGLEPCHLCTYGLAADKFFVGRKPSRCPADFRLVVGLKSSRWRDLFQACRWLETKSLVRLISGLSLA
jgi:hypothetical protein